MVSLTSRKVLAALAAGVMVQPALAQDVVTPTPPPMISIVEAAPLTPEERRKAKAAEEEYMRVIQERGVFGHFLLDLDESRRALACGDIAEYLANASATAADPRKRAERLPAAWRLNQRVASAQAQAKATLTKREIDRFELEFSQAMDVASLIPDPEMMKSKDFSESNFLFQYASALAMRCHQSLDENGVPDVSSEPPPEYIERHNRFRFRGMDYVIAFGGTAMEPYAKAICSGTSEFDFSGAPLEQRGYNMMSLLDWAVECEDKAAFEALIAAGFDLDAPGLWDNPPVVNSATEKRLWFLRRLLDAGANPDAMGNTKPALAEAMSDLDAINSGSDTRAAFNLLRERGASLNFPEFAKSVWFEWGLFGRNDGWSNILEHWDEFESDPVQLANLAEEVLEGDLEWLEPQKPQARKVKDLLIEEYNVCFPVGDILTMAKDERGFLIQPNCVM
jgi:hypothetical protein